METLMERRTFLRGLTALGCSAAAHPWLTTVTLAQSANGATPLGDHRMVVIILRGAMDGLDVVRPLEDPILARLRPTLSAGTPALPLGDRFGLHPSLGRLMPLWARGELAFAHAVSTPYRDKRSHFDGQDLLEAGTGTEVGVGRAREGWLNRMLQAVPGLASETAFAVGRDALPLLAGRAPTMSWTPEVKLALSAQSQLLLEQVWHDDDLFRESGLEAMQLSAQASGAAGDGEDAEDMSMMAAAEPAMQEAPVRGMATVDGLIDFAVSRLLGETRIAAFSQGGWDTHRNQARSLQGPLGQLEHSVLRLAAGLGPQVWGKTILLAMTEFGRTVAQNGTAGTDHGTGGVMLMAGGALKGGRVMGRWPGLAEADLYDRRDLMPTSDVRAWAAWAMHHLYGLDRQVLEAAVFPGLDMGDDPGIVA
ncbi:MAG: DUF1501 domain-containing protein [Gemmobacter sp.]